MLRKIARGVKAQLWWGVLVVGSLGCFCDPPNNNLDRCENPTTATVDSIEVASVSSDRMAAETLPFTRASDGDGLFIVRGFQGADMVGIRFRFRGGGDPDCVNVQVALRSGRDEIASDEVALDTHATPEGQVSSVLWLQGNYQPGPLEVSVTAAGKKTTVTFQSESELTCTAKSACPCTLYSECLMRCSDGDCLQSCREGLSPNAQLLADAVAACALPLCQDAALADGGTSPGADGGGEVDGGDGGCRSPSCRDCVATVTGEFCDSTAPEACGACRMPAAQCLLAPP